MKTPARRRIRLEPALWLAASLGVAMFALAEAVQLSRHWPAGLISALLASTGIAAGWLTLRHTSHIGLAAVISGWCGAFSLWLAFGNTHGPWHVPPLAWLAGISAAGMLSFAEAEASHRHAKSAALTSRVPGSSEQARKWVTLLEDRGFSGCKVTGIDYANGVRSITYLLPATGTVTYEALAAQVRNFTAALRLTGDAAYFSRGTHDGEVILRVMERDVLAEPRPFPAVDEILNGKRALSILDLLPFGVELGGGTYGHRFYETGWKVTAEPGSGKSNLLNVAIALVAMCEDAFPVLIDPKGGRLAAPWIRPWIEGRTAHPILEWVAVTREETWQLTCALDAYLEASMKSLRGGSKARPSRDNPMPVVFMDESADVLGDIPYADQGTVKQADLIAKWQKITRKMRSEAVSGMFARQRGTVTHAGPNNIWHMLKGTIGLGVSSEADARLIMPDNIAALKLLARLQHPGAMVVNSPQRRKPDAVGVYLLDPAEDEPHGAQCIEQITQIAVRFGQDGVRPRPSDLQLQAFRQHGYDRRWEKSELYATIMRGSSVAQASILKGLEDKRQADEQRLTTVLKDVHAESERLLGSIGIARTVDPYEAAKGQLWTWWADRPYSRTGFSVAEAQALLGRRLGVQVRKETIHDWFNQWIAEGRLERLGKPRSPGVKYRPPQ